MGLEAHKEIPGTPFGSLLGGQRKGLSTHLTYSPRSYSLRVAPQTATLGAFRTGGISAELGRKEIGGFGARSLNSCHRAFDTP
jgi:hypothetical protein